MLVVIPQITWHSRDPVLSVDFDPSCRIEDGFYRIVSGGGDCQLLVWHIAQVSALKPEITCVAELKRHEKPVNVVRFSPDGNVIASGGDDAYIILWKCEKIDNQENWLFEKSLRKHTGDISDLSWSPDGNFLVSGSIDNTAVLWDVKKGIATHVWSEKEHNGFVHGVSYDPLNDWIATMCIDRNLRFFEKNSNKLLHKVSKYPDSWIPYDFPEDVDDKENAPEKSEDGQQKPKKPPLYRLFQDDLLPTFCRRLSFSPRGELLMVPGGMLPPGQSAPDPKIEECCKEGSENVEDKGKKKANKGSNNNAVVVFCRNSWTNPCAVIPTVNSYSIISKFCPVYFNAERKICKYDDELPTVSKNERTFATTGRVAPPKMNSKAIMKMPYRLVYAIATNDNVLIGDTYSVEPLAVIRSIHLARITDLSWSSDGRSLIIASYDGYCSLITFGDGELGERFVPQDGKFPELTKDCFPVIKPDDALEEKKIKKRKSKSTKTRKSKSKTSSPVSEQKQSTETKPEKTPKSKTNKNVNKAGEKNALLTMMAKSRSKEKCVNEDTVNLVKSVGASDEVPECDNVDENETPLENNASKKLTPQKTTLDRWFKKTSKNESLKPSLKKCTPGMSKASENSSNPVPRPELIVIDDDSSDAVEKPKPVVEKFPMTPPSSKPISKRRVPILHSSPLTPEMKKDSLTKRRAGVSPEEIHRLKTAPIKCSKMLTEEKPIIMMSSPKTGTTDMKMEASSTPPAQACAFDGKNTNTVASPLTTSTPRPPRRINPITLTPKPSDTKLPPGNLD